MNEYWVLIKSRFRFLLFGLLTVFFANYGQTFFIALFGEAIRTDFSLSHAQYGFYYSIATLASGLSILFIGKKLDDIPVKRFTLYVCFGLAFACLMMSVNTTPLLLIGVFYLLRLCGQGLMGHIAMTSMGKFFNKNRGKAVSISALGMPLGEVILPALMIFVLVFLNWREVWLLLAFTVFFVYVPIMIWALHNHDEKNSELGYDLATSSNIDSSIVHFTRKQVLQDYRFFLILPAIVAPGFLVTGVFFHLAHIAQAKQWSVDVIAGAFVAYGISHMIGSFLSGHWVDKFGVFRVLKFYLWPITIGFVTTVVFNSGASFYLFMALAGLSVGISGTVSGTLWPSVYGTKHLAAIRAMLSSFGVIATAVSPALFGALFDMGLSVEFLLLGCLSYGVIASILASQVYKDVSL